VKVARAVQFNTCAAMLSPTDVTICELLMFFATYATAACVAIPRCLHY
jgi:hypothetical protein